LSEEEIPELQVLMTDEGVSEGVPARQICKRFDVSKATVWRPCTATSGPTESEGGSSTGARERRRWAVAAGKSAREKCP
jgi:transposase